ncbi:hypothetical protein diail_8968 [Diaporthe ilicicola]|nr:hypothetical protein diail_8968 [Diaporthe ilicicola]
MPPRIRGARAAPAGPAAPGRQSTRIAAQMEAAQQAAGQPAADEPASEPEAVIAASAADDASHDTDASLNASPGENDDFDGNAAPESPVPPPPSSRGGRGTGRGRASVQSPDSTSTPASFPVTQSEARGTPLLTPRTRDATANLMNKFVDRLFSVSRDVLSHLTLEGAERDETWGDELQIHKDIFGYYYKIYNLNSDVFIDIDVVSSRTKAEESPFWPRMIRAVATANLANLLADVEDLEANPIMVLNRLPLLQRIDEHFPASFVPGGQQGLEASVLDDDMLNQAFHIRTQRYIETLRGVQKAVPSRLFARVFLDLDVEGMDDDLIVGYIEAAPLRAFPGFDINGASAQKYRDAINGFRAMIVEMDSNAIISKLEQEYPFHTFLENLKDWVKSFEANIQAPTQPSILNGDGSYSVEEQLQQDMRAAQIGKFHFAGIERIRHYIKNASSGEQAFDFGENDASPAPSTANFSMASTDLFATERARDLSQAAIRGNDGSVYAAAAADATKRSRKRGRKSGAEEDPASKRARAADASAMPPPPPPRQNGGGAVPPSSAVPAPIPGLIDVVAMSRASQLISKANRKPAQPKQRRPWTAHDTQQLVRAVNVYKAKWSTIERAIKEDHIPFNVPERDQQGLRDKARLVKVDILKTDSHLPPGFDLVVLGRKEKDMVIAAGRNPERKEEDNDPDQGTPRNTLYDPASQRHAAAEAAAPQGYEGVAADAVDDANLRALQEAQMQPEAPIGGGAPTAPMLAQEGIPGTAPSEDLGEFGSQDPLSVPNGAVIDNALSEAGPSNAVNA